MKCFRLPATLLHWSSAGAVLLPAPAYSVSWRLLLRLFAPDALQHHR